MSAVQYVACTNCGCKAELVGVAEVAVICGWKNDRSASNLTNPRRGFPAPVITGGRGRLWDRSVVVAWAELRAAERGPKCGTNYGYVSGCRCDECREANNEKQKRAVDRRASRVAELPPEAHGKVGTYQNWRCRCEPCKAAMSERNRRNALRRKERAA